MTDDGRSEQPRWRSSNGEGAEGRPPERQAGPEEPRVEVQPPPAGAAADRYSQWLSASSETVRPPEPAQAPPPDPVPAPVAPAPPGPDPSAAPAQAAAGAPPQPAQTRPIEHAAEVRRAPPIAEDTSRDRYADPVRPRLAGVDPREPVRPRSNRSLLIGGAAAAIALAALAGWALTRDQDEPGAVVETVPPTGRTTDEGSSAPTQAAYAPPDREAVRDAYGEVGRVYSAAGVSGLAEAGRSCFANLGEAPSYRGLDYCGALDAYGAAFATRVSGSPAPADSWFGQAETRFVQTAERVMGPERDAAARLVDIRRLAIEVAREGGPGVAAAGGPAPQPSAQAGPESTGSVQVTPVEPQPSPAPPPPVVRQAEAAPRSAPAQPARVERPSPAPAPAAPDRESYAAARPQESGPTAAEVAAARPREGRGPSFNCRYARSASEQLVCGDAQLSRLDRRLNEAFEDAIAAGVPRRELRREQDGWLVEREAAAPDRDAVRDAYRRRIRELEALQ